MSNDQPAEQSQSFELPRTRETKNTVVFGHQVPNKEATTPVTIIYIVKRLFPIADTVIGIHVSLITKHRID